MRSQHFTIVEYELIVTFKATKSQRSSEMTSFHK